MKPNRRISIPPATRRIVLLEAGYKCANPVCRHILTLELHHIVWVKDAGGNDPDNLVALCPNCHSLHTAGHIPADAIRCWKSLLISLNSQSRASADILLVLFDEEYRIANLKDASKSPATFHFTGDGLLFLSPLIASGLIEISTRRTYGGYWGPGGMPSFEVRLTEKGKSLVEAWRSGVPEAISRALSSVKEPHVAATSEEC